MWRRWGFGDVPGEPYEDGRFPVEHIDQFYASWPLRVGGGGGGLPPPQPDNPNVLALEALLERIGPAVLMPHSAGGPIIFNIARKRPEQVTAIVVLEPTGCPTAAEVVEPIAHIPFLAVYGDYIESRNQTGRLEACRTTARLVREMGGRGEMLELTEYGIRGNSHLLMQDDNSAEIASRVMDWLDGLTSPDSLPAG